ncbi:hypothetical protein CKO11_03430 [Rhodobacter sp. TJ_12]|uniref:hypothetical protein n=1 Tax=Rhodobacter sp. TJ_12 TaxID=2029399 RepID=UPI001CC0ECA3|nr:hypothetical protein [Rhodobacter sp. TJ_12]MBZ4021508.1 hypothetical protein [Rhodobacter sp. TJ_12]
MGHAWVRTGPLYTAQQARDLGTELPDGFVGLVRREDDRVFAVDGDGFALLEALDTPKTLDRRATDKNLVRAMAEFAMDGVIAPASASAAAPRFIEMLPSLVSPSALDAVSRNVQRSYEAIDFALDWSEILGESLSASLYVYGRRQPHDGVTGADLEHLAAQIDKWAGLERVMASEYWQGWHGAFDSPCRHKLYVSADASPAGLADAFAALPALPRLRGAKIPAQAYHYGRPDYCVLYLADEADVPIWSAALREALSHMDGLGLSFTTPLDRKGVVSLGVDLPDEQDASQSHRARQSGLIAHHIHAATQNNATRDDRKHELHWRLFLHGYLGAGCISIEGNGAP